jgi:mono/diheme cytochrome c family protein
MSKNLLQKPWFLSGLVNALVVAVAAVAVTGTLTGATSAWADGRLMPSQLLPIYKQECAACHMAYPPGMLPAASWQRIMSGLERHYGTDASLEPAQVKQISVWLKSNAGTYKRVNEEPPEDRITRSAWFARKHREVEAAVWKRASIKSAAQCAACHTQAEQGNFNEHQVRIPR